MHGCCLTEKPICNALCSGDQHADMAYISKKDWEDRTKSELIRILQEQKNADRLCDGAIIEDVRPAHEAHPVSIKYKKNDMYNAIHDFALLVIYRLKYKENT